MNDIWNFLVGLGDGLKDALNAVNPLPVLVIGILIGFFQPKPDRYLLKAAVAVVLAIGVQIMWPALLGRAMAMPDIRHLASIAQVFILFFFAYGIIGVLGTLKTAMK
ncbi:MAG: hypothetical protein JF615_04675, partial [Asticcacaulis sp.]|nr:hypothetical protein [Asticcacaulis sp.]